jgi:integrase
VAPRSSKARVNGFLSALALELREAPEDAEHQPSGWRRGVNALAQRHEGDATPQWTKTNKALAAESRAALDAIDLHFHDLRHEAGSRLLERGWALHHVQAMLGHADAKTTSIYLNVTTHQLLEAMRRSHGSLHDVARDEAIEQSPPVQQAQATDSDVTVN